MIIGCFALVEPFAPMKRQFEAIKEMGIDYADLTDNHNGGMLDRRRVKGKNAIKIRVGEKKAKGDLQGPPSRTSLVWHRVGC